MRQILQCLRCGYEWISNTTPKACANPKCRSPYWNRPRTRKATVQAIKK